MDSAEQQKILSQNTDFLKGTFGRAIFPCMLTILSANINLFVDGILVGAKLGSDALAAISLSLPLYLALCVAGSFISSGTAICAASAQGENNDEEALVYFRTSLVASFIISLAVTVLGLALRAPLTELLCTDASIRPYVMQYVSVTLMGALPKIMIYIPLWYLRLEGKNGDVAILMGIMSVGNIILDVIFVYVMDMGVTGAAIASVIATVAAFIPGLFRLFRKGGAFRTGMGKTADLSRWKDIAAAGSPSALNNLLSTVRILILNTMLLEIGGGVMVAVFTAVTGIAGFGECITMGIPMAAGAMLGVYSGEKDNGSSALLVRIECRLGLIYTGIFSVLVMALSPLIPEMYGLSESLFIPLLWMCLSLFAGLLVNIISGYYNMSGKSLLSNAMIVMRSLVFTYIGVMAARGFGYHVFSFLLFSEAATLLVWYWGSLIYSRSRKHTSRYLLMDTSLDESGSVINFSVDKTPEEICEASERISEFCAGNGMNTKQTMSLQLAMEEIMTLIAGVNKDGDGLEGFDLRAFSIEGVSGVRIRYGGQELNPFRESGDDEMYMGIDMIKKMVEDVIYRRTFGVNTLLVMLKES